MLATLLVGATYVPIDAHHTPRDRIIYICNDSQCDVVIYDEMNEHTAHALKGCDWDKNCPSFIQVEEIVKVSHSMQIGDIETFDTANIACILYTSGTTGLPKGVAVRHSNIHNSIHWWKNLVKLTSEDKVLHFSSYSFVMCLRQIFPTFAVGATLVVPPSPTEFADAISKCLVTKLAITPSALQTIDPSECRSLKIVQVAGEAPNKELATRWARELDAFYIGLGPTVSKFDLW